MTEHKHLKRLVRERVAGTGESYSTARRHVLAQIGRQAPAAAALPPGLVPGYDTFGGGQHHASTLLAHLLRQAGALAPHTGRPYSEAMICGLAGGIGFMVAVFEYRGVPPILTIVAQHHPEPWAPAALNRLGIGFAEEHSGTAKPALAALRSKLDSGRAVSCLVARGGLPWHADAAALPSDPCRVVVAGHHEGTYWLDDESVLPQPITEEQFASAWSAHKKGRHERLVIVEPAASVDLADAVRSAVATTVAHLTGPVLGNAFDVNFGFSGMRRLAEQLRDERGKTGWSRRFAGPGALTSALRRLYECLELQHTGPGATRPLYADFLDEAAGVVSDPRLADAAQLFRASAEHWSAVASRAAAVLESSGPYADLVERRMFRLMCDPTGDSAAVRELSAQIEQLGAAGSELPADRRAALFAELAELVDAARTAEEAAVTLLR
jgi:hypothetical protein